MVLLLESTKAVKLGAKVVVSSVEKLAAVKAVELVAMWVDGWVVD